MLAVAVRTLLLLLQPSSEQRLLLLLLLQVVLVGLQVLHVQPLVHGVLVEAVEAALQPVARGVGEGQAAEEATEASAKRRVLVRRRPSRNPVRSDTVIKLACDSQCKWQSDSAAGLECSGLK